MLEVGNKCVLNESIYDNYDESYIKHIGMKVGQVCYIHTMEHPDTINQEILVSCPEWNYDDFENTFGNLVNPSYLETFGVENTGEEFGWWIFEHCLDPTRGWNQRSPKCSKKDKSLSLKK